MNGRGGLALCLCAILLGCTSNNLVTQEQIKTQNAADSEVAVALFERDLTERASYNVHKDGFVVIKFDRSVDSAVYTEVVQALRDNPLIKGVRAEQAGREVCPLR